ncbi:MAG TPA: hypothetical protein VIM16_00640 [Mucilaginibacter sp.]|jgi:hypothetical protein
MEVLLGQGEGGGDLYTGEDAQNKFRELQGQQQPPKKNKKQGGKAPEAPEQSTYKKWIRATPVFGLADKAGDELKDGQYGNAALDEGSAMLEALMFVPGRVADAGLSFWDSVTGLFTKETAEVTAATNGETAATALGRAMHTAYKADEVLPGVRMKEFTLPNGLRVDFIDLEKKIIYELKPNNPRAIKAGYQQLGEYLKEVERVYGKGFQTVLDKY